MMGAKNHCVILPDAVREGALSALAAAAFGAAGQRCMATPVAVFVGRGPELDPRVHREGPRAAGRSRHRQDGRPRAARLPRGPGAGREAHPVRRGPGGEAGARRARREGRRAPRRQLRRPDHLHRHEAGDGHLPGGNLRPRPLHRGGRRPRRRHPVRQRQPQRQRGRPLHPGRLRRAQVPGGDRRRPGGHQPAHPGAGRLLQLHRIARIQARRPGAERQAGRELLDADEDRHGPLAEAERGLRPSRPTSPRARPRAGRTHAGRIPRAWKHGAAHGPQPPQGRPCGGRFRRRGRAGEALRGRGRPRRRRGGPTRSGAPRWSSRCCLPAST